MSQRTAARTFSDPGLVAPDTRRAVEAAAAELGYVPNAIARSLKSQRSGIVGVVVPSQGQYYHEVIRELAASLAQAHSQMLVFSFQRSDVDAVIAAVRGYQLDGLILASASVPTQLLDNVASSQLRVVSFNDPMPPAGVPAITVDNSAGVAELVDHLAERGARSVTFVNGIRSAGTNKRRRAASRRSCAEHGIEWSDVNANDFSYEAGRAVAQKLVDNLPDAVMAAGDELALGVIDGLRLAGVVPGTDVMLTGFDGLAQAGWASFELTTIEQPLTQLVAETVSATLDADGSLPEDKLVSGALRLRQSTLGPPRS